ncbi:MAG: hypothetical protein GY759_00065 [Chloroflexi bacterium]|nr:hypothetical protein [Chloroflexota bacterium]
MTRYTLASFALLALALGFLLVTSFFLDASLAGLPSSAQRWIGVITLILPALLGFLSGIIAVINQERSTPLAILGIVLNILWIGFFSLVLSIAG